MISGVFAGSRRRLRESQAALRRDRRYPVTAIHRGYTPTYEGGHSGLGCAVKL